MRRQKHKIDVTPDKTSAISLPIKKGKCCRTRSYKLGLDMTDCNVYFLLFFFVIVYDCFFWLFFFFFLDSKDQILEYWQKVSTNKLPLYSVRRQKVLLRSVVLFEFENSVCPVHCGTVTCV